jgi:hypothetical protein
MEVKAEATDSADLTSVGMLKAFAPVSLISLTIGSRDALERERRKMVG